MNMGLMSFRASASSYLGSFTANQSDVACALGPAAVWAAGGVFSKGVEIVKQLQSLLQEPNQREILVTDCVGVIEAEVKSKTGLTGMAVKTAYGVVKAIKPGIIRESVDGLLDEFVEQLQPFYERFQSDGASGTLQGYLGSQAEVVAESLLVVTDRRAQRAKNKTLVKAYNKLRPKGKEHVVAAVPRVGGVLDKHVPQLG